MSEPITQTSFEKFMADLTVDLSGRPIAVGVSGGPDSMALAFMLVHFTDLDVHMISVDHGLREEAADEVALVRGAAKGWGAKFAALKWEHGGVEERVQEAARHARYDLMAGYCDEQAIDHLFLAHHMDDQAETVLFRLSKGTGLDGLAGMRAVQARGDLTLARPLLNVPKAALIALCDAQDVPYISDPSNVDEAYARVRLRKSADVLEAEGLSSKRLSVTAKRLARASAALDEIASGAFEGCANKIETHRIQFCMEALAQQPDEIGLRVLMKAVAMLGADKDYAPRMERLEDLFDDVIGDGAFRKRTLGGVIFERDDETQRLIMNTEKPV